LPFELKSFPGITDTSLGGARRKRRGQGDENDPPYDPLTRPLRAPQSQFVKQVWNIAARDAPLDAQNRGKKEEKSESISGDTAGESIKRQLETKRSAKNYNKEDLGKKGGKKKRGDGKGAFPRISGLLRRKTMGNLRYERLGKISWAGKKIEGECGTHKDLPKKRQKNACRERGEGEGSGRNRTEALFLGP